MAGERPPSVPKPRPDPRPMRLVLGAGAFAAASITVAGMVRFPVQPSDAIAADAGSIEVLSTAQPEIIVRHRVRYVQLRPGEHAPKGAKVIDGAVPTPRVVVTRIAPRPATTRRVVVHTRQSGR